MKILPDDGHGRVQIIVILNVQVYKSRKAGRFFVQCLKNVLFSISVDPSL